MSAPSTRTSTSSSWMAMRLTAVGGGFRPHQRHQTVLERKIRLRKPAIAMAQVPAPGFLQALFEGCGTYSEHARGFAHFFGDRGHVEVHAKISGIAHRIAADMLDRLARYARQLGRLARGGSQRLHHL